MAEALDRARPPRRADHERPERRPRRYHHARPRTASRSRRSPAAASAAASTRSSTPPSGWPPATRPDVFIAEPVGSCTDLRASVSYPLRRMYGDAYTVAPLSVVVDPVRALRVLGIEPGRSFTPKVLYVYRKQLEEAGLIVDQQGRRDRAGARRRAARGADAASIRRRGSSRCRRGRVRAWTPGSTS